MLCFNGRNGERRAVVRGVKQSKGPAAGDGGPQGLWVVGAGEAQATADRRGRRAIGVGGPQTTAGRRGRRGAQGGGMRRTAGPALLRRCLVAGRRAVPYRELPGPGHTSGAANRRP
ncbi:hypothetical protein GCM10009848_31850 [Micromonospora lupini]